MRRLIEKLTHWLLPNELNRHDWVGRKLKSLSPGLKILDAGAGQQPYRFYCKHLHYFTQDFGVYKPQGAGLQIKDWKYGQLDYEGDIWDIKEKDSFFDVVLCTEVLEHVPFPNETLREFSRLLKPGGVLLITSPYACLPHMQPYFYYSGFSREYYQWILKRFGFERIEIKANGNFFMYLVQENLRGVRTLRSLFGKILYAGIMILPILWLRFLGGLVLDEQLVFGYHIQAIKHDSR